MRGLDCVTFQSRVKPAIGILPYLEAQPHLHHLDEVISDWIEWQWVRGESVGLIADALSGLHFYWPEVRGHLRGAWRLFKQWRKIETPCRAPPLTQELARAFVAKAVSSNEIALATLIALGFHGLLRTGELLALRFGDIEFNQECGVVSLHQSKTGLRTGSQEAIAVRDLQLLDTLVSLQRPSPGTPLWPRSAQSFRASFRGLCNFFKVDGLNFKPYSLRRGGATYLLQNNTALESILVRGRWRSLSVARLYLQDGLAQIPGLRSSAGQQRVISAWASKTPVTAFRP